jgi:uncharacterized protein
MPDSVLWLPVLLATGAIAGLVDSIAGGGGLITIPVLLGIGLPPQMALGTNKFQASFGSFTAAYHYVHKSVVELRTARTGIVCTLIGAALGTWTVQQVQPEILKSVIPFLLLAIALYTFFTPALGEKEQPPRLSSILFYMTMGTALGFYDGFFGPGVGSFWAIAYVLLLGFGLTKATGYTKVMNFTSNVVSLVLFLIGGHVVFIAGIMMAAGQIVGARLGSGMAIRRGAPFIRPVYVSIVVLTTIKLLYDRLS